MLKSLSDSIVRSFSRVIALTALMIVLLWLLFKVASVLLLFTLAIVFALILNAPVTWLEKKHVKRHWAALIVFGTIFILSALVGWLILPKVFQELRNLLLSLPGLIARLAATLSLWFSEYPDISKEISRNGSDISQWMPSAPKIFSEARNYSAYLLGGLFLFILFVSIVGYAVSRPRALLEIYYSFFDLEKRQKAQVALQHTSKMLIGWIRANLIGGGIEAVCSTIFLSIMNVPGAWVWGALTLLAELIPNIGFYIMAIPPVLVAFSVGPFTAMWVLIFYVLMNQIMGTFLMPRLLASKMNIHPVSTLFMLLVMGAAFGLVGALLTVPVTAIIKAYYEAFYKINHEKDPLLEKRIDSVIYESPG